MIGPPILTPNWFRWNGGISPTVAKGRESNLSLRRKSNAVPVASPLMSDTLAVQSGEAFYAGPGEPLRHLGEEPVRVLAQKLAW